MPINYDEYLKASNGLGEAVRANVVVEREPGSIEINVDSVLNWPSKFIATSGVLDSATGTLDPETVTVFYGHINGTYIEIDEFAPGYFDIGNQANELIVIKPTTPWADHIVEKAENSYLEEITEAEIDEGTSSVRRAISGRMIEYIISKVEASVFLWTHPVGSTYWNKTISTNPGTLYGGTWVALEGVVLGGISDDGGSPFNVAAGTIIGADTHTLTESQIPAHSHQQRAAFAGQGIRGFTSSTSAGGAGSGKSFTTASQGGSGDENLETLNKGGGQSHNNIQRTLVGYLWERIA